MVNPLNPPVDSKANLEQQQMRDPSSVKGSFTAALDTTAAKSQEKSNPKEAASSDSSSSSSALPEEQIQEDYRPQDVVIGEKLATKLLEGIDGQMDDHLKELVIRAILNRLAETKAERQADIKSK